MRTQPGFCRCVREHIHLSRVPRRGLRAPVTAVCTGILGSRCMFFTPLAVVRSAGVGARAYTFGCFAGDNASRARLSHLAASPSILTRLYARMYKSVQSPRTYFETFPGLIIAQRYNLCTAA